MSQVLTVPTHFNDIGELSEGFLDRVEQDTLILYGPVPYEEGSDIDFVVLLSDGTAALEGKGRVRASVDGGAERVPETRYDVVVEALELDGRFEVVFESLVMARQAVSEPPPEPSEAVSSAPAEAVESEPPELEVSSEEVFSIPPDEVLSVAPEASDDSDEPEMEISEAPEDEVLESEALESEALEDEALEDEVEVHGDPSDDVVSSAAADADDDAQHQVDEADEVAVDTEDDPSLAIGELSIDAQATLEKYASGHEGQVPTEQAFEAALDDGTGLDEHEDAGPTFEEALVGEVDEDGQPLVAAEPNVGGPVPRPSIAAPPDAPPAPAGLNLVPPPEGLTRPSRAAADEDLLASFEEPGDEEDSGLFAYEEGLPIPSRPPLPDLDSARRVATVEANDYDDVEESEPPEAHEDYEEIRLSELAESAEEG